MTPRGRSVLGCGTQPRNHHRGHRRSRCAGAFRSTVKGRYRNGLQGVGLKHHQLSVKGLHGELELSDQQCSRSGKENVICALPPRTPYPCGRKSASRISRSAHRACSAGRALVHVGALRSCHNAARKVHSRRSPDCTTGAGQILTLAPMAHPLPHSPLRSKRAGRGSARCCSPSRGRISRGQLTGRLHPHRGSKESQ